MKTGRKKTTYFRKDYAPARAARQKSPSNRAQKVTATISKGVQRTTSAVKTSARKAASSAKTISTKITNSTRRKKSDFIRSSYAKPRRQPASAHTKREPFTWREYTLLSIIGVCGLIIMITLGINVFCDPVKAREEEFAKITRDYYIEFLYPSAVGHYLDQPETILKAYTDHGLPNVKIRQLLLYDNGKYLDSRSVFSNAGYDCDPNKSYVRYFPVAPYGPYDYTIYYNPVCEETK